MTGVLTKTVIRSPVIRWILQARIRHRRFNDVIFVGDDLIHVKQVRDQGHLEHIATKVDFGGRIRSAKTFTIEPIVEDEDFFMKIEDDESSQESQKTPPQCLVLATDSNELLFICMLGDGAGGYRFVHQTCPLPVFDEILFQPGEHLAVDPSCRALAVAANEREVVIYSAKSNQKVAAELRSTQRNWSPISSQRPLKVDGVIQQMDFLTPPSDDEDRIILLLILANQRMTRAVCIDWRADSDLYLAEIHPSQPLDTDRALPNLLIPLQNTSFFLVNGSEIKMWTNILCGPPEGIIVPLLDVDYLNPGESSREPMWANWCRPLRSHGARDTTDHLYLAREDGAVVLLTIRSLILSSHAGELQCHVSSAFASLGGERDPDILIAAGDMSSGRSYSIGHWPSPIKVPDMSRPDTMVMNLVQTMPNWATVTDMVTSSLPGKSQRNRDGVFLTSGRQPHGAITELRHGLEARLSAYFVLEGLRTVTDIWALPLVSSGYILLILSSPSGTRFISSDSEMEGIDEVDATTLAFDSENPTLAAAFLTSGHIVQITRASVRVSPGTSPNFEDVARVHYEDGSAILAAAISPSESVAITAERQAVPSTRFELLFHSIRTNDADAMDSVSIEVRARITLESEPLCVWLRTHLETTTAFVALSDGHLFAYTINDSGSLVSSHETQPTSVSGNLSPCDSIAGLYHEGHSKAPNASLILLCGLRDGGIYIANFDSKEGFRPDPERVINFSQSAVKLMPNPHDASTAYATSGLDMCLLSLNADSASPLNVQNIWITDKVCPQLPQNAVVACTHLPQAHFLTSPDLAGCLAIVSEDDFLVATLERNAAAVPRQIPVSGTPNRLIYAEHQRSFVCASLKYGTALFPPSIHQSKPEERRQIWPVVDFIPCRGSEASFSYEMQPGERIFALLEWSFKSSEDKTYSFILVGGSYTKSNGSTRGRITFLQPVTKNKGRDWTVVDVKEGPTTKFEAPVYSLALLDDTTYVACVGKMVIISRFSGSETRWDRICSPFKLSSPGLFITVDEGRMYISTAVDGLVTLDLRELHDQSNSEGSPRFTLVPTLLAPRADTLLSHTLVDDGSTLLCATKYGQLIGFQPPLELPNNGQHRFNAAASANLIFEASISRSLTRIKSCDVRPRWKPQAPVGTAKETLIGCAPDGALVGIAVLSSTSLIRRLSWLQRLCEWSEVISPHTNQHPPYSVSERSAARNQRAMPIGLSTASSVDDRILLDTNRGELRDKHIDGDVLDRLLQRGGAETLREMIRETSERNDRVGEWMRRHLDEEIEAVDGTIDILKTLLDCWL